jgi:hypothetical protein
MRVALCISGELRSFQQTYKELSKNIIEPLEPDIFLYSWDQIEGSWKQRNKGNKYNNFFIDDFEGIQNSSTLSKDVVDLYHPADFVLENFLEEYKNEIKGVKRPRELLSDANKSRWSQYNLPMFYTLYKCNELKKEYERKNNFTYDMVIKIRTDVRFPKMSKDFDAGVLENTLWYYPKDHNESHVVSDKFAFSNSAIMDYYSSVFTKLTDYWDEGMYNSLGHWKIGEEMMWHHFYDKSDISVKSFGGKYYDGKRAQAIRKEDEN